MPAFLATLATAREYHISVKGSDQYSGTSPKPFRTINRAAQLAQPGDTISVHTGTYREWVNPARGGESEQKRILYRGAKGEKVKIKGSEIVSGWKKEKNGREEPWFQRLQHAGRARWWDSLVDETVKVINKLWN